MSPAVPSVCFRTVEIDIKHQRKNLNKFFRGGHGLFGLILAAPLEIGKPHADEQTCFGKCNAKFDRKCHKLFAVVYVGLCLLVTKLASLHFHDDRRCRICKIVLQIILESRQGLVVHF